jgi:hypothetical protein
MTGQHPGNELAASFGVPPTQVLQWKKQALEARPAACSARRVRASPAEATCNAQLYQPIGQLTVELDGRKKQVGLSA